MEEIRSFDRDSLRVRIFADRKKMGTAAAEDAGALLRQLLENRETVRVIFAAAPSQNEFLDGLCRQPGIDWRRVEAFHMDEYVGLADTAPQGFGNFLRQRVFDRLPFGKIHYLNGNARDPEAECARYGALLAEGPIDIVFLGIGENGHIAFNDPPVADFKDEKTVKIVKLDEICRNQQVHDGCFEDLPQVPTHAMTLTVPVLAGAAHHLCIVPAATKAGAVRDTLEGPVAETCPASILRTCKDAVLYLDRDSAGLLKEDETWN